MNLLKIPFIKEVFLSRFFPGVFQYPLVLFFAIVLVSAFFGTIRAGENLSTVATWTLWWSLLPFSFLFFSRFWCAVCPLAKIGDLVQKIIVPKREWPGSFLKKYGVWIMSFTFLILVWADRVWSITNVPRYTGLLLVIITIGSVIISSLYKRRVWCRYLCPIGALTGIYSMTSLIELRAKRDICSEKCKTKDCFVGRREIAGCPLIEFPMKMDSNRNCNLCGNCIKACPHNAIELRLRIPGKELFQLRNPLSGEAFLAIIMMTLVFIQTYTMTFDYPRFMKWSLEDFVINNYNLMFSIAFFAAVFAGVGFYLFTSDLSGRLIEETTLKNFTYFGYAFIPVALAGHMGHDVFHLAVEGKAAFQTVIDQLGIPLSIFELPKNTGEEFHFASFGVKFLMVGILLTGAFMSFWALWKIAKKKFSLTGRSKVWFWPNVLYMGLVFLVFLYTFLIPMNLRHVH